MHQPEFLALHPMLFSLKCKHLVQLPFCAGAGKKNPAKWHAWLFCNVAQTNLMPVVLHCKNNFS
jgi:hypothetical protein